MIFSNWMPWSLLLYLLAFLVVISMATVGSGAAVPLLILNAAFLSYAVTAAWVFYTSITGNPRDEGVWVKQLLFLNPYTFGGFLLVFLAVNLATIWRWFDGLFYRHPPGTVVAPVMWTPNNHRWEAQRQWNQCEDSDFSNPTNADDECQFRIRDVN